MYDWDHKIYREKLQTWWFTTRLLPIVLALFLAFFSFASIFLTILSKKALLAFFGDFRLIFCKILCGKRNLDLIIAVQSLPDAFTVLILVKWAKENWEKALIGQWLLLVPSPSTHLSQDDASASSSTLSGSQPAKAGIARERTLESTSGKNKSMWNCDAKKWHIIVEKRWRCWETEKNM